MAEPARLPGHRWRARPAGRAVRRTGELPRRTRRRRLRAGRPADARVRRHRRTDLLGLALLFALLLDTPRVRLATASRIGIFLPYAVPGVIASLLWGFLYLPNVSPIRDAFASVGLPEPDFLAPGSVLFSVANIGVWGGVGFNMIVLYTALRGIPREMYDAARIDGASEVQIALRVKIPLIAPALVMTGVFSIIATLQVFSEPATLQPLTDSIPSSWVPLMTIYRDAFVNNDIHTAAAASVVLALGTLVVSLGVLSFLQKRAFGRDL
ncbi:carbohydrate ABC transporter permease [Micromonospora sp. NPDC004704]